MPIYAYRCEACGHAKDVLQRISDPLLSTCPACGAEAFKKQLTAAGFQLKGSGWYVTDFKGDSKAAKPAGEAGADAASKSDGGNGDAGKADTAKTSGDKADSGKGAKGKSDGAKSDGGKGDSAASSSPAPAAAPASSPSPGGSGTPPAGR